MTFRESKRCCQGCRFWSFLTYMRKIVQWCPMVPRQSCLQVSGFSSSWWVSSSKYSSSKRWCYWSVANVPFDMLKPAVQCLNQLVLEPPKQFLSVHCYQLSPKKQVWEVRSFQNHLDLKPPNITLSLEEFIVPLSSHVILKMTLRSERFL